MRKCNECKWWEAERQIEGTDGTAGYCHRYPPSQRDAQGVDCYPAVFPSDWCGEFNPQGLGKEDVPSISLRLIHNCQFTHKVENILEWKGIQTLGDLSITSPHYLLSLRMFGPHGVRQIESVLERFGIDWDKSVAVGTMQTL